MQSRAVPVPAKVARFEGQMVAFLDDLFTGLPDTLLRFASSRGETYTLGSGELGRFCLLSTNTPSWKLVPAGREQLDEITVPRFVLRDVALIEVGVQADEEQASDRVYTNLTEALENPRVVRFLNLTSAWLESFPTGIFELVNLESLNLGKNRIQALPPEVGELRHLQVLKLSRNKIRAFPEEIGRLKQLTELHASRNEIERLPERLWNLERLELLNLGRNRLTDIPSDIGRLVNLKELELDHNPIPKDQRDRIQQLIPNAKIEW